MNETPDERLKRTLQHLEDLVNTEMRYKEVCAEVKLLREMVRMDDTKWKEEHWKMWNLLDSEEDVNE